MSKKSKKKISLFLPSLRGGGAERVFLNLAKGFAERGFSVDLILAQKEGAYLDKVPEGVKIVDLNSRRILYSLFPLVRYLKKEQPDVLLSAIFHVNIISVLAILLSGSNADLIVTEHNPFSITQKKLPLWERFIVKFFMRVLYKRTKAVVTVSKGVAEDLKSLGLNSKNFKVIYNPMDIADIKKKAKEDPKHEWLENKSQPILLGVGRLTYQKDFAMLIKAFSKICKNTDARLIILGEGEERKNLQKLVNKLGLQDHVDMPGFVDNPYAYMSKAEVFVLSSRYEGFGNVLVEAMACGTPVVSTNCPVGPSEILDKGKYGKLVPVGDVEAMEKAIIETLHNLKLSADELQKRASHFSVERATDRYLQLID